MPQWMRQQVSMGAKRGICSRVCDGTGNQLAIYHKSNSVTYQSVNCEKCVRARRICYVTAQTPTGLLRVLPADDRHIVTLTAPMLVLALFCFSFYFFFLIFDFLRDCQWFFMADSWHKSKYFLVTRPVGRSARGHIAYVVWAVEVSRIHTEICTFTFILPACTYTQI